MRRLILFLIMILMPSLARAADYAAANETIWPSQNDVAQVAGNGKKLLENQWSSAVYSGLVGGNNMQYSGLTVPASSANLNINVALGAAWISQRFINIPGATTITATNSA